MTPTTKATIMHALAGASVNASNDLYLVKCQFERLGVSEMEREYAESGLTCRHVLDAAQREVDNVAAAIKEIEALP